MDEVIRRLSEAGRRMDHANTRPRDAGTLIILDRSGAQPKVLMGRRHHAHVFLPGTFVFPGGRVDPADRRAPAASTLHPATRDKLMARMRGRPSEARARALALAALRETFEEAGLLLGERMEGPAAAADPDWAAYLAHGVMPRLDRLVLVARAITPPRRPRRFDTRFLLADATEIALALPCRPSAELEDVHWVTLSAARDLELPSITRVVIEEVERRMEAGSLFDPSAPVPFYHWARNGFRREFL